MYIVLAPIKLKPGVSDETFVKASDEFEVHFVSRQQGILKRILLKGSNGDYADLVYFEDLNAIDRVVKAEKSHPSVGEFFNLMEEDSGEHLVYEVLKTYE